MSKATQLEKENRIFTIQGWIIDGVQDYLIEKQMEQKWGIKKRQAARYIKEAYSRWKKNKDIEIEERRDAKVAELKQLKRTLKDGFKGTPAGINAILRVEKEINKLEDLYPARKVQLSNDPDNPVDMGNTTINQVAVFQLPDNHR